MSWAPNRQQSVPLHDGQSARRRTPGPATVGHPYDQQLRTDAETTSAIEVTRLGPMRLVTFPAGRGFVTY